MQPPSFLRKATTNRRLFAFGIALSVAAAAAASLRWWGAAAVGAVLAVVLLSLEGFVAAGVSRVGAALVLAPLTSCFVLALISPGEWWLPPAIIYSYFFGLLGIPLYFVFKRLAWLRFWQVILGGTALGTATKFLFFGAGPLSAALLFGSLGGLTSAVFWVLAFARLPGFMRTPKG